MFRRASSAAVLMVLMVSSCAVPPLRGDPNPAATPANQLVVSGNACGPTALFNAFRFGSEEWQRALTTLTGSTDKERIYSLIRGSGMRPSKHLSGQPRWTRKGVNIADLCDMANETTRGLMLPPVSQEVLFLKKGESQAGLLHRVHQQLGVSLAKGLPPVLSLRRYVLRKSVWTVMDAHFVTLLALPAKLDKGARSFPVTYADPWGGRIRVGTIAIPERMILSDQATTAPCLEAIFPDSSVGKKLVHPGEQSSLALSAALGRW